MALPPADPARHRRALLRRALIGWIGGGLVVLLIVAAVLGGGAKKEERITIPPHSAGIFDYHMSSEQFHDLHEGEPAGEVLDQLGTIGLPEGETEIPFIQLFPPHEESLICSYWQIYDSPYTVARLCFSRAEGVLRQKLERKLSGLLGGAATVPA
ncbi:MAG TPA: hypothetical protein VGG40_07585 [Solirubrobacterales bacterium]|jgi:hypothetical protein